MTKLEKEVADFESYAHDLSEADYLVHVHVLLSMSGWKSLSDKKRAELGKRIMTVTREYRDYHAADYAEIEYEDGTVEPLAWDIPKKPSLGDYVREQDAIRAKLPSGEADDGR